MSRDAPRPRRRGDRELTASLPAGYRTSRRGSKTARRARKAVKARRTRESISDTARTLGEVMGRVVRAVVTTVFALAAGALVLFLLATAVNGIARWNAERRAARRATSEGRSEAARDNLLVIGVDGKTASGLLALKIDVTDGHVWGIAIPGGAFMEVPGQGFERVGESYRIGPDASEAAVSNYLAVPFEHHIVVDKAVYQAALENQDVSELMVMARGTDLAATEKSRLRAQMEKTPSADVGLVSLPVTPISLGDETYFEPQRDKVADLLKTWWGAEPKQGRQPVRVIIYNGSGTPGVAGMAAQDLIRRGYRVVDTRNADRFDYAKTLIVVHHGGTSAGEKVRRDLGVGSVSLRESSQQVVDVIVIIGKDYAPPPKDG